LMVAMFDKGLLLLFIIKSRICLCNRWYRFSFSILSVIWFRTSKNRKNRGLELCAFFVPS